jgi:hypothetical protein
MENIKQNLKKKIYKAWLIILLATIYKSKELLFLIYYFYIKVQQLLLASSKDLSKLQRL